MCVFYYVDIYQSSFVSLNSLEHTVLDLKPNLPWTKEHCVLPQTKICFFIGVLHFKANYTCYRKIKIRRSKKNVG